MTISATITRNPFYQAVYDGKGTYVETVSSIVGIFNASTDRTKLKEEDYTAFRDYLADERIKFDEGYAAALVDNPFPAKNELSQTLAKADDLPADILKKITEVSQQYTRKAAEFLFLQSKGTRLHTAYKILSEAEKNLTLIFPAVEVAATRKAADAIDTKIGSINMTTAPIPGQQDQLKKMSSSAALRLAGQKEREAQRVLKDYLDSGDAFRVKRELQAPEPAKFKRRIPAKAL